ncbi:MAG: hypothetical protein NTV00_11765 [Methylococcales bacterium]|nr:hypothetical protein [Methylococcales bacterium]
MKNTALKQIMVATALLLGASYTSMALAHTAGGPIGATAGATDLAAVQCYDDGNGSADHLVIQIEDFSAPVAGLLMSMQASKGIQMINITDTVSGDGNTSPAGILRGGDGEYRISVNKSNVGTRSFSVTYHCETIGNTHTGTDINALQLQ